MKGKRIKGECSKSKSCKSVQEVKNCKGCSYKDFDKLDKLTADNTLFIKYLKKEYFSMCSKGREGIGGRIPIDEPFKRMILQEVKNHIKGFPELVPIKQDELENKFGFKLKCDGAFSCNDKYFFYEIKGVGNDTNSILSAITAAHYFKDVVVPRRKINYMYFYIGIQQGEKGLKRNDFFEEKRVAITPYTKWAESKEIMKFYGILDIRHFLEEIKAFFTNA